MHHQPGNEGRLALLVLQQEATNQPRRNQGGGQQGSGGLGDVQPRWRRPEQQVCVLIALVPRSEPGQQLLRERCRVRRPAANVLDQARRRGGEGLSEQRCGRERRRGVVFDLRRVFVDDGPVIERLWPARAATRPLNLAPARNVTGPRAESAGHEVFIEDCESRG